MVSNLAASTDGSLASIIMVSSIAPTLPSVSVAAMALEVSSRWAISVDSDIDIFPSFLFKGSVESDIGVVDLAQDPVQKSPIDVGPWLVAVLADGAPGKDPGFTGPFAQGVAADPLVQHHFHQPCRGVAVRPGAVRWERPRRIIVAVQLSGVLQPVQQGKDAVTRGVRPKAKRGLVRAEQGHGTKDRKSVV